MWFVGKWLIFACLLDIGTSVAIAQVKYTGLPLTKEGIINQLQQKGRNAVKPKEMVKSIRTFGVNFNVSPAVEAELLTAGARPEIIQAAKDHFRLPDGRRASFLTIESNVSNANFEIERFGTIAGAMSDQPLLPGSYRVTARRPGYENDSKVADLQRPGSRVTLTFTLREASIATLLADAEAANQRADHRLVDELCRLVLRREPANKPAKLLLAWSLYARQNFAQASLLFLDLLRAGEQITFSIAQVQGKGTNYLDAGKLILGPASLVLISDGKDDFDVPYSKVKTVRAAMKSYGWRVNAVVLIPKKGKEKKGEEKEQNYELLVSSSRTVCSNCELEAQFIAELIATIRAGLR